MKRFASLRLLWLLCLLTGALFADGFNATLIIPSGHYNTKSLAEFESVFNLGTPSMVGTTLYFHVNGSYTPDYRTPKPPGWEAANTWPMTEATLNGTYLDTTAGPVVGSVTINENVLGHSGRVDSFNPSIGGNLSPISGFIPKLNLQLYMEAPVGTFTAWPPPPPQKVGFFTLNTYNTGPFTYTGYAGSVSGTVVWGTVNSAPYGELLGEASAAKAKDPNCNCTASTAVSGETTVADPIDAQTGNVFDKIVDYQTIGRNKLAFIRYYNSLHNSATALTTELGPNWRSNFERFIHITSSSTVTLERKDGRLLNFTLTGGTWTANTDIDIKLTNSGSTWTVIDADDTIETYANATLGYLATNYALLQTITLRNGYRQTMSYSGSLGNQLSNVTDSYGRALTFTYSGNLLSTVSTPDHTIFTYGYNASGYSGTAQDRLIWVSYSTSPIISQAYLYEDANLPWAMTGINDENGHRFATWTYDTAGRGTSSKLGDTLAANLTTLAYDWATGNTVVTGPGSVADTYEFATTAGVPKLSKIDRAATSTTAAATKSFAYDANGYLAVATDWNGNATHYTNNSHGQPTTIVEAYGTAQARTTTITYDTTFTHLPHEIVTAGLTTDFAYDGSANLLTKTLTDTTTTTVPYTTRGQTRIWTYTWSSTGQLLSVRSPRTDVVAKTTYGYTGGTLTSIIDALNHTTTISAYTNGGLPLTIVDPNGVTTSLAYDTRLRLHTSSLSTSAGLQTTTYDHDAAGNLTTLTLPDQAYFTFAYDNAHRLVSMTAAGGYSVNYALDVFGNIVQALWKDASGTTQRQHSATFDAMGRIKTDIGGVNQTTTYSYDGNGNIIGISDPLSHATSQSFDALSRLTQITDPLSHSAGATYDAYNRPLTVTDKNNHPTGYIYDGFGELIQETSPDRGVIIYTYDKDGNLLTKVDAVPNTATFTYDALDRQLTRTYSGDSSLSVTMTYDQTGHGKGIGRLTTITDQAGTLLRSYDERGNIITDARTISGTVYTTTYSYNAASKLSGIVYPKSGLAIDYTRNASDDVTTVTATLPGKSPMPLASSVAHLPFGPIAGLTYGNSVAGIISHDQDYRTTRIVDTGAAKLQDLTYGYDADNNVQTITDALNAANSQTLAYDQLDRLTSAVSGTGGYGSQIYIYDANGNRTKMNNTSWTIASASNHVTSIGSASVQYTASGNIKSIGSAASMTYNRVGQLSGATGGGNSDTYKFDALGQRLSAAQSGYPLRVYQYDQDGALLMETDNNIDTDYVYLDGAPIAVITPSTGTFSYLHTDQLGTPTLATNGSKAPVWGATYDPFGNAFLSGSIIQNLRFPGQFVDNTGFNHNGFRDYDPTQGRYLQSDLIGLNGGFNTYAYVEDNPLASSDPTGLGLCFYSITTGRMVCLSTLPVPGPGFSGQFASGNNNIAGCKNNPFCINNPDVGPLPIGTWYWDPNTWTSKKNRGGTALKPIYTPFTLIERSGILTHSCANPFGPSIGDHPCSEGCVTGTTNTINGLNGFLRQESKEAGNSNYLLVFP